MLEIELIFIENTEKIGKNIDLSSFSSMLYLLSANGFYESPLFKIFDEFFLQFNQENSQEKLMKAFLYTFQISANSIYQFSFEFYEKLFGVFVNNNGLLMQKFNLKELSIFLRTFSILWVNRSEKEIKILLENTLSFMFNSNILKKIEIKSEKLTNKEIKFLNSEGKEMFLEIFFQIYQFLFTFKEYLPIEFQKIWQIYSSFVDKTDFKPYAKLRNSSLEVDIMEILNKMKVNYTKEKQIKIYFIDIFIEPNIAIEVLGNKHYSRDKKSAKPKDLLKANHLKELGYVYIEIPFFEFSGAFFTDFEWRRKYVFDKLKIYMPELKRI